MAPVFFCQQSNSKGVEIPQFVYMQIFLTPSARSQICPPLQLEKQRPTVARDLNIGETRVWRLDSEPNLQPFITSLLENLGTPGI